MNTLFVVLLALLAYQHRVAMYGRFQHIKNKWRLSKSLLPLNVDAKSGYIAAMLRRRIQGNHSLHHLGA